MRIALIVELKKRELPYLLIIKEKLELKGHKVKLIPQRYFCGINLLLFRPNLILVNGLRSYHNFVKIIQLPKLLFKSKLVSWYSEQVGTLEGLAETYNNQLILKSIDFHVVWGEKFRSGLIKMGVKPEDVKSIGSFGLDLKFYVKTSGLREYLSDSYGLDHRNKWILVSDNIINRGNQKNQYESRRLEYNRMVDQLSKGIQNVQIILRPHPENNIGELNQIKSFFNHNPNVIVCNDEHILVWIKNVEAAIVWYSTSAIESWVSELPVFCFRVSTPWDYWHEDFLEQFSDVNKIKDRINSVLKGTYTTPPNLNVNREKYIKEWFGDVDGSSMDRLTDIIQQVLNSEKVNDFNSKISFTRILKYLFLEIKSGLMITLKGDMRSYTLINSDSESINNIFDLKSSNQRY